MGRLTYSLGVEVEWDGLSLKCLPERRQDPPLFTTALSPVVRFERDARLKNPVRPAFPVFRRSNATFNRKPSVDSFLWDPDVHWICFLIKYVLLINVLLTAPAMAASAKRKQEEKHLKMLREMTSLAPNRKCFDCDQRGPTYANMTVGSFVCTTCSGIL